MRQQTTMKQLIVRVEGSLIRQLKILAAHKDVSMADMVREVLDQAVAELRREDRADKALKMEGL